MFKHASIFEFGHGCAFFHDQDRDYRVRLGGDKSGYVWLAPLNPETGAVISRQERQALMNGGRFGLGATVMWSGDKSDRATFVRALEKSGYSVRVEPDAS